MTCSLKKAQPALSVCGTSSKAFSAACSYRDTPPNTSEHRVVDGLGVIQIIMNISGDDEGAVPETVLLPDMCC